MNEPDIAPLARRLAEENNVDWRRLEGSGDGGRIVERDVLTYLAKVMAGEEDLDPTPEPVPEGMQAWPDADVAAYRPGTPEPPVERSVSATLDDDLFLFDDASSSVAPPAPNDAGVPPVFEEPAAAEATAPAVPDEDEDEDGLLLVDEPDPAGEASALGADDPEASEDVFAFDAPGGMTGPTAAAGSDLPDLFGTAPAAAGAADDELFVGDAAEADDAAAAHGIVLDLDDRRAAVAGPRAADEVVGGRRADDVAPPEEPLDDGLAFVVEDAPADVGPTVAASARTLELGDVAMVRHGQVWRRRLDDRAFRSAVSQIADALGAAPSAVAVALLARAVRGAWPDAVAVAGWWWTADGERRRDVATDGRIAEAIVALEATDGPGGDASPTVVVADLSSIALDEAVLHLEAPVLALGRATGDGAWLTLSGDDVPREAVAALGRVAEALAAPVRLLV